MLVSLEKDDVILTKWNILRFRLKDGTYDELFVGYSAKDRLGRVSTKIIEYDFENKTGRTESGSTYKLIGEPGHPGKAALYVIEKYIGSGIFEIELFSEKSLGIITFKYPF